MLGFSGERPLAFLRILFIGCFVDNFSLVSFSFWIISIVSMIMLPYNSTKRDLGKKNGKKTFGLGFIEEYCFNFFCFCRLVQYVALGRTVWNVDLLVEVG